MSTREERIGLFIQDKKDFKAKGLNLKKAVYETDIETGVVKRISEETEPIS